ncbi:MAG: hypothetical protein Q8O22_00675 [Candidatus Omnitrophota bacterium]|nr:hypothetical protein [Candidatus Omnitrophota bacterium]
MAYDHIRILNTLFASGVWYEMTLSEVRVYVAICSHWNWQSLEAYPSINTLTAETRLSAGQSYMPSPGLKTRD